MHNHSCENEFNLHVNEISFSYEKMGTKTRFEEEAKDNSEMAYYASLLVITPPVSIVNDQIVEVQAMLAVCQCHAFKIDRNAIPTAGAIRSENYSSVRSNNCCYPFEEKDGRSFQSRIQNYSAFRTAEVFRAARRIQ